MPGPNALETLLTEKYGIPEAEAQAYAAQIIGGAGGGHEQALRQEALSRVATEQQDYANRLARFPAASTAVLGGEKAPFLDDRMLQDAAAMLDDSAFNTQVNAMNAAQGQQKVERANQHILDNVELLNEVGGAERANAAQARDADVRARAEANYATDPRTGARIPRPSHWVTNEQGVPIPTDIVPVQPKNPYDSKLARAEALRKQILGF